MPTAPPTIASLPDPPSTASPATFDSDADALLGALPDFRDDLNAVAANVYSNATGAATDAATASAAAVTASNAATTALNAPATQATTTSTITIGGGSKPFTLAQTGKAFAVGQWVLVADTANPSTRWLAGGVSAFNSGAGSMTIDVAYVQGSGTGASWSVTPIAPMRPADPPALRNRIINGDCVAAIRGDTPLVVNTSMYGGCDRIAVAVTASTASGTIKQEAGMPTSSKFAQGITNLTTTGVTGVSWSERIELRNCSGLNGSAVTLSGRVYQETGATRTFGIAIYKANAPDNFSGVTQIGVGASVSVPSGVWTDFSETFTLGASDADNGLQAYYVFNGLPALTAKNFYLGELQFEPGSMATPFEAIPVGLTRLLCARYCQKIGGNIATEDVGHGVYASSTDCRVVVRYQVPLRTNSPSVQFVGPASDWTAYDASSRSASALGVNTSCRDSLNFSMTVAGATAGQAAYIRSQSASTYILVSAEL